MSDADCTPDREPRSVAASSSPNLSRRRLDVCHTYTHGVALVQVWNLSQKSRQKSPSGHHRTTLSGYIFATKARIENRKKSLLSSNMSSTCPHNMANLRLTSGWDRSSSLRHPCKCQQVSRLGSVTARYLVVGVSQTLQHCTEGATCVRQGDHHVGHWPTFLVISVKSYITGTDLFRKAKKEKRRSSLGRGRVSIGCLSDLNTSAVKQGISTFFHFLLSVFLLLPV